MNEEGRAIADFFGMTENLIDREKYVDIISIY